MRTARTAAGTSALAGAVALLLAASAGPVSADPGPADQTGDGRRVVTVPGPHGPAFRSVRTSHLVGAGEADSQVHALPGDAGAQQWALHRTSFEAAWAVTRGAGVVVAVVDTGVDASLPGLRGRVLRGATFQGAGHEEHSGQRDRVGHGTHVAGIIAADPAAGGPSGAAPGVTVLPVSVLDEQGSGWSSDVANGIVWAVDHGASVVNLSFGSSSPSTAVRTALQYAQAKGVVVVAAAGNDGPDGVYEYPAAYPGVVGVGAVDQGDAAAPFSTTGPFVDLVAPGESVLSTWPRSLDRSGTATRSGTSMAAPYVTAAAALVRATLPTATGGDVVQRLLDTAEDLGPAGRDDAYGSGLVDPARALGASGSGHLATLPPRLPAPTGLRLTVLPDETVGLSWDPVPGARSYAVLLQGLPLNLGTEEGDPPVYGLHGTDAHFPQFPRGLPLPFEVVAVDDLGLWSPRSATFTAVVPARPLPAPLAVRASAPHSRTVRLSWAPVRGRSVTGYGIIRDGEAYQTVEADTRTFVDSPVTAGDDAPLDGRDHSYRVVAFTDDVSSDPSAVVVVRPYAFWATSAPQLKAGAPGARVHVAWSAGVPGQAGWRVYVDGRLDRSLPVRARGTDVTRRGRHTVTVVRFRTSRDQGPRATVRVDVRPARAVVRG